ncbi:MAG: PilZ domain-containing protein [Thermodesulfovibrionales bacterium]|nr:PilZ domain-containing protein [Thermodesulfovibrionales bacterium]
MAKEERSSKRTLVLQSIKYFLTPSIIENTYDGVVTDISNTGACLLTTSLLKDRQRIIILDKSSSFEKAAIVRWSQKYDDIFYKVGLEFIEDQTFMNIKNKRRYKRLKITKLNMQGNMAFVHHIKIVDISLGGLLIETDKKWNIGEEYILHIKYEEKIWPIKGYIVWSILKEWTNDYQGKKIPIYSAGMKLTSPLDEIQEVLKFIELRIRGGGIHKLFSFSRDEDTTQEKDTKHLETYTHT